MTGTGFSRDVEAYPDDSGVSWRLLPVPVGRKPAAPPRPPAKRRDGTECDPYAGLPGMPGPADPEDTVSDWRPPV